MWTISLASAEVRAAKPSNSCLLPTARFATGRHFGVPPANPILMCHKIAFFLRALLDSTVSDAQSTYNRLLSAFVLLTPRRTAVLSAQSSAVRRCSTSCYTAGSTATMSLAKSTSFGVLFTSLLTAFTHSTVFATQTKTIRESQATINLTLKSYLLRLFHHL